MTRVSVVIPALNEEDTVAGVVARALSVSVVSEVFVIDNASSDRTPDRARLAGAEVISCELQGMGEAVKTGINAARNEVVLKIDADIRNPHGEWFEKLASALAPETLFANGYYDSDYDEFPVGTLVAKPALSLFFPELEYVRMPLAGTYIFRKNVLEWQSLPGNWAFDIGLLLLAHEAESVIGQVPLGMLSDRPRRMSEYRGMATDIFRHVIEAGVKEKGTLPWVSRR